MRSLVLAVSFASLTACVDTADSIDGVDLGETESAIGIGPTVLTFYESANWTGASYSVELAGATDGTERIKLISKPDITTAGLLGKISSVRLKCGPRDARVVLFNSYNASNTSFAAWDHLGGVGATINCTAGLTKSVNLHTSYPSLADKVGSAFLTTHAADAININFMDYFESAWAVALDELPSNATPTDSDIWMTTTKKFEIRQYLDIDYWACTKRGAVFEYSVTMHDDGTFSASIVDTYVDYGTGDAWGCHDDMLASLKSGLTKATPKLTSGLQQLVDFLAPDENHLYFVPDVHLWSFDLFYTKTPIGNAPL